MALFRVGGATRQFAQKVTLNPSNVTASSVSKETFAVTGVRTDTLYVVNAPDIESGIVLTGARATANNVLELTFWNPTGSDINPASQAFYVCGI
jgi:hypothetical protein